MAVSTKEFHVSINYGLGGTRCEGRFDRGAIAGVAARDVIDRVTTMPQPSRQCSRTASLLREALSASRPLDVEIADSPDDELAPGRPVDLDDVVLDNRDEEANSLIDSLTLRVSESFVGGANGDRR